MAEKPESDVFLAGLDAKIAALQQLRDSYLAALSIGAVGQGSVDMSGLAQPPSGPATPVGQSAPSGSIELPTGVFRTTGLADAIRLYLSIAKRKQTIKEIGAALQEGGLATTAGSFERTLSSTLYRLKSDGELLKFKDGWDLAASYPESFRQRLAQNAEGSPRRKRKGKKKADNTKKREPKTEKHTAPKNESEPAPILRAV